MYFYMIKKAILSVALMNGIILGGMAAHTGHVYVDNNNNGIFDKGEKGLSGVLVSDGLNVVKTANDGSFSLPGHAKELFILLQLLQDIRPTTNTISVSIADRSRMILACSLIMEGSVKMEVINMCTLPIQRFPVLEVMTSG